VQVGFPRRIIGLEVLIVPSSLQVIVVSMHLAGNVMSLVVVVPSESKTVSVITNVPASPLEHTDVLSVQVKDTPLANGAMVLACNVTLSP